MEKQQTIQSLLKSELINSWLGKILTAMAQLTCVSLFLEKVPVYEISQE
ncbi:hypothetical protein J0B02_02420 [Enterobacteriaceae bacterium YMB-R22]|jgi:hypothetical protein|nr:hypothetical protein [Tenebrionicola larvae]MBV4411702.1 hypothetical protein [Tenebrionicola larvae]